MEDAVIERGVGSDNSNRRQVWAIPENILAIESLHIVELVTASNIARNATRGGKNVWTDYLDADAVRIGNRSGFQFLERREPLHGQVVNLEILGNDDRFHLGQGSAGTDGLVRIERIELARTAGQLLAHQFGQIERFRIGIALERFQINDTELCFSETVERNAPLVVGNRFGCRVVEPFGECRHSSRHYQCRQYKFPRFCNHIPYDHIPSLITKSYLLLILPQP